MSFASPCRRGQQWVRPSGRAPPVQRRPLQMGSIAAAASAPASDVVRADPRQLKKTASEPRELLAVEVWADTLPAMRQIKRMHLCPFVQGSAVDAGKH